MVKKVKVTLIDDIFPDIPICVCFNGNVKIGKYKNNKVLYEYETHEIFVKITIQIEDKWNPKNKANKILLFIFNIIPDMDLAIESQSMPISADFIIEYSTLNDVNEFTIKKSDIITVKEDSLKYWRK